VGLEGNAQVVSEVNKENGSLHRGDESQIHGRMGTSQ